MGQVDPFQALTVAEAAELAGVSVATVRDRIQSGALLHEVGRRRGREVQLVRRVDLAGLWPAVLPGSSTGARTRSTGERRPEPEPATPASADVARAHALEVRLASLQSANDGLSSQVRDLQLQRSDLKEQCVDLRGRMTSIERERQASTAGLLLAQRRLLELEAARPAAWPDRWRRPVVLGVGLVVALLGSGLGWQWRETSAARGDAADKSEAIDALVAEQRGERERFARELDGWRASSGELRDALEASAGRAQDLAQELRAEHERSAADRERFELRLESTVEATLESAAAARQAILEERAEALSRLEADLTRERDAAQADRDRFARELDRTAAGAQAREAALRRELDAARAGVRALEADLDLRRTRDEEREARLEAQLVRLADLERALLLDRARGVLRGALAALWRAATGSH